MIDSTFVPHSIDTDVESHDHVLFELHSVFAGRGQVLMGAEKVDMLPNTLHLFAPHFTHAFRAVPGEPYTRSTLRFAYQKQEQYELWYPRAEVEQLDRLLSDVHYQAFGASKETAQILRFIEQIHTEMSAPSACSYAYVQTLFAQLLLQLIRLLPGSEPRFAAGSSYPYPQRIPDEMRTRVIERFFANYKEKLTIEQLAEHLHLSARQVNRVLLQLYNMSFKQKLLSIRMEISKELLRTSSLTVQQIALKVGYATTSHFGRVFLNQTGCTPEQYSRLHRNSSITSKPNKDQDMNGAKMS